MHVPGSEEDIFMLHLDMEDSDFSAFSASEDQMTVGFAAFLLFT